MAPASALTQGSSAPRATAPSKSGPQSQGTEPLGGVEGQQRAQLLRESGLGSRPRGYSLAGGHGSPSKRAACSPQG